MNHYYAVTYSSNYLEHHGIKGMHWGIRRFQNEDGSLTGAGRKRYGSLGGNLRRGYAKVLGSVAKTSSVGASANKWAKNNSLKKGGAVNKAAAKVFGVNEKTHAYISRKSKSAQEKQLEKAKQADERKANRKPMSPEKKKKLIIGAAAVAATGLAAYGAYKLYQRDKLDRSEMEKVNTAIKDGQSFVKLMQSSDAVSEKVTYLGNDLKYHTATMKKVSGGRDYSNVGVDTQKTFETLKEFRKARKRYSR